MLVIIYGYKVAVIGGIYSVIRFVIDRIHTAYLTPKHTLQVIDIEAKLRSMTITGCYEDLLAQLDRLTGIHLGSVVDPTAGGRYVHTEDVAWLCQAIDDKLDKEEEKAKS